MDTRDLNDEQIARVMELWDYLFSDEFEMECLEIDFEQYMEETGWLAEEIG